MSFHIIGNNGITISYAILFCPSSLDVWFNEILATVFVLNIASFTYNIGHFVFKDMKWIEEKQALYRRNQELVEKVFNVSICIIQIIFVA